MHHGIFRGSMSTVAFSIPQTRIGVVPVPAPGQAHPGGVDILLVKVVKVVGDGLVGYAGVQPQLQAWGGVCVCERVCKNR